MEFSGEQELDSLTFSWELAKCSETPVGYPDALRVEYYPKGQPEEGEGLKTEALICYILLPVHSYIKTTYTITF